MSLTEFKRGVPTYKDNNDNEYGLLCETKEVCVTDNGGVSLEYKLQSILCNISDLTTRLQSCAKNSDLSNYFKNTGGKLTDNVVIEKEGNSEVRYELKNGNKNVSFVIGSDGSYGIYEVGRGWLFLSDANGNRSFDGTASGNLSLTGGTLDGPLEILEYANAENERTRVITAVNGTSFLVNGNSDFSKMRQLAIHPITSKSDPINALEYQYTDDGATWGVHTVHHDGNSAKVVISETAPSDTSALWVW